MAAPDLRRQLLRSFLHCPLREAGERLSILSQTLTDHVGADCERPHGGPGGDPGVQLQQGQQAPRPHHAVPHRSRGGPHGGADAEMV
ncbi:homeobox only domain, isoform CRA_a [Rattus norvegicus]|uniref:Homeobox only domain, isoform CRA_a n=1 Tax=Rattus norvegicus TaxID=10116 RepID=A6JCV8_RAT|nr:homeobox only domain, isoform CRA_a [Rattus norvegicus]